MLVYKDRFTGDEICSDSYQRQPPFGDATLDEIAFEVTSRMIAKGEESFGITDNSDEALAGAGGGSTAATVIDIVDAFRLVFCELTKNEFTAYIKAYMKRVKNAMAESHPDRIELFSQKALILVKRVLENFKDFDFYMGESMDQEAQIVMAYYQGEEPSPRFIYISDGVQSVRY